MPSSESKRTNKIPSYLLEIDTYFLSRWPFRILNTQSSGNYDPSGTRSKMENLKGTVSDGQEIQ